LLKQVVSLLTAQQERLLIVLDDYHHLKEQEEIRKIMVVLLQQAPPCVTFIINGRIKPDLPLVQLKLNQQLAELSSKELAFDRDETEGLFRELFDLDMSAEELQLILQKTEGWAASLVLLWDALKNMDRMQRKHFLTHMCITEDIYSYLVTEVLGQQPEDLQSFLLNTSLVEELDPVIINQWLEISDSQKKIEHLHAHHLFLSRDHRGVYRYHQLFKTFLYQRLKSKISQSELNQKHAQLGKIYEKNCQLLRAFVHYTWGNEYVEAARLLRVMVNRYQPEWFLHVVDGALESLSPDHSLATTSLFLFRSVPLEIMEELIPALEENIDRYRNKDSMIFLSEHRLANIYFFRGDLDRAIRLFQSSAQGAEQARDFSMVSLNLSMISEIYRFQKNCPEAIRYARKALSYFEQHNIAPHVLMHGLWNLSETFLAQNDPDSAEDFILQTIAVSDLCDDASKVYPYCSMSKMYRLRQNYEKAIEWGQKAVEHASRFRINTDLGWAHKELGITYLHAKQLDLAEECLRKAQRFLHHYTQLKHHLDEWLEQLNRIKGSESSNNDKLSARHVEPLVINVLGELEIQRGNKKILITRKSSVHLFLLLLLHRGKKLTKDYIMEQLFPQDGMATAQNKFYVSLSILRKCLEPERESGRKSSYIKQQGDNYYLSTQHIQVDADDFLQWTERMESPLSEEIRDQLRKAEACYKGEFASDFPYVPFLAAERERLHSRYLRLLERLARHYWETQQFESAFLYYDKILAADPYHEQIYEEYVDRLLKRKLVVKARSVYAKAKHHLEDELGIPLTIASFPEELHKAVRNSPEL